MKPADNILEPAVSPQTEVVALRRARGVRLVGVLFATALALVVFAALFFGLELAGRYSILGGFLIVVASQIAGFVLMLRDPLKAMLALIVPGYVLFALNREGYYAAVVGSYLVGAAGLVVGTVLLS